jgi:hypothetical protein
MSRFDCFKIQNAERHYALNFSLPHFASLPLQSRIAFCLSHPHPHWHLASTRPRRRAQGCRPARRLVAAPLVALPAAVRHARFRARAAGRVPAGGDAGRRTTEVWMRARAGKEMQRAAEVPMMIAQYADHDSFQLNHYLLRNMLYMTHFFETIINSNAFTFV